MFSLDRWQEVLSTLARAPLRSILTSLAVAWGIFMLVVLLGFGHGLRKGAESQFADDAANSVWVFGGQTSQPYQGMPIGRRVSFTNTDYDNLRKVDGISFTLFEARDIVRHPIVQRIVMAYEKAEAAAKQDKT